MRCVGGVISVIWGTNRSEGASALSLPVEDRLCLVAALREEGCNVLETIDDSEYGKFAGVINPEGNKVELWQPPSGK